VFNIVVFLDEGERGKIKKCLFLLWSWFIF